jgi:hypothetical protein
MKKNYTINIKIFFVLVLCATIFLLLSKRLASADCVLDDEYGGCILNCSTYCNKIFSDGGCSFWTKNSCEDNCGGSAVYYKMKDFWCCEGEDPCSGGGCFTPSTQISTPSGQKEIEDIKVKDKTKSFDPETGVATSSVVDRIYEVTRSAYYKLKLKSGKEVEVTAEHPLYAIQQDAKTLSFWEYLKTQSLTKKLIDKIFSR